MMLAKKMENSRQEAMDKPSEGSGGEKPAEASSELVAEVATRVLTDADRLAIEKAAAKRARRAARHQERLSKLDERGGKGR